MVMSFGPFAFCICNFKKGFSRLDFGDVCFSFERHVYSEVQSGNYLSITLL